MSIELFLSPPHRKMDFGAVMEMDGLVSSSADMDSIRQRVGLYRSGLLKHARPGEMEENDWMCLKAQRNSEVSLMAANRTSPSPSLINPSSHCLFPEGQQMLSFSSPKQDSLMLCNDGGLAYYQPAAPTFPLSSSSCPRNAGVRGPFTPSQWMELEHQALIYKYLDANVPVPSSLLAAIRKSFSSSGFPSYPPGSLRTTELGWNPFQLGFSGNADPEPGRCRRTDGKKWRCSRDAVADQKYCERHMNRGRHRSRKPVEGHSGHAAKPGPLISPPIQSNNNDTNISNKPFSPSIAMNKESGSVEESGSLFSAPKPNPLRHFFDDWPKTQSNRSVISWPEVEDIQSERTQLSISIPMASSEFSSSSSSPNQKRTGRPVPSKLSREADATHMGLGVGQREASWIPVSWESSMGGPLGEVLNKTASNPNAGRSKNPDASSLNLMAESWERTSPGVGSSPTGVLQKSAAFASLSSSTGSSPRADVTCDNLLVNSTSIPTL